MKKIIKLLILAGWTLTGTSCADLDIRSDGRVSYKDIFSHYERTVNYYNNCTSHILSVGFTYDNSPLLLLSAMKRKMPVIMPTETFLTGTMDTPLPVITL